MSSATTDDRVGHSHFRRSHHAPVGFQGRTTPVLVMDPEMNCTALPFIFHPFGPLCHVELTRDGHHGWRSSWCLAISSRVSYRRDFRAKNTYPRHTVLRIHIQVFIYVYIYSIPLTATVVSFRTNARNHDAAIGCPRVLSSSGGRSLQMTHDLTASVVGGPHAARSKNRESSAL